MKKVRWVSAVAGTALVAAAFALPGAGVAYASGNGNITGNGNLSLLSGNTVNAPVSAPVNLCGVSLAVLGFANSGCEGGATSNVSGVGGGNSDNGNITGNGNVSAGSGNTLNTPVSAPVSICGVSVAAPGYANSHCKGGATSNVSSGGGSSHNGNILGNSNVPVGSGNTLNAPVSTPLSICGISLATAGLSNSGCKGGSTSCVGDTCGQPSCQGDTCYQCHGDSCQQCHGDACYQCHGDNCQQCHGDNCQQCHGDTCYQCHGDTCYQCHGDTCYQCHGDTCQQCHGDTCQQCHGDTCQQCHGDSCYQCHGDSCQQCHGDTCSPCNCAPPTGSGQPQGTSPGGTSPGGTSPGGSTVTTSTVPNSAPGLPTTGADLLLLGVAAIGSIGVGAGTVALARRRRHGEAS